ncbi:MAG: PAS domain S-box protein [Nostoc sp. DedVER02]|uniref:PAS domain S-box protein n=1 Tax=unclassified Nostoc TaxID=2593658 RepID=UPI002AD4B239|nr:MULTISPECIES: PAS domain S-box protein [unclassified Nostoc]MDZ7986243.1 PAS domain S-box protein [Nostoc sp. DedVER02]MDZ8112556.1 PAS domain S-box protein [Nostoc sp. DedVER01b]
MFLPHSFLLKLPLENTIAPPPITVTPDVLVTEAIALLNSNCNFDPGMGANDCIGCLAVVSENQLVGLFSERVVTRLVASGRSLAGVTLAEVIEPPAIALRQSELTNPDVALSLLQKHQIQHLPILDDNGQLLGLLTYESLCRLLQPVEPDRPDEASIAALKLQTERSQLLMAVSTRIRASLSLAEILNATVSEVRQFLGCDRVSIYHFLENGQFQVVAESLAAGQRSFVSEEIYDPCFAPDWADRYGQGRVRVVADIYTAGMTPCHVELLERLQIRAKVLVPAIVNNQFWGLVSASESAVPRDWQPAEVTFLEQLAIQVAIAIQHSETATRFQQQGQELIALLDRSPDVIFRLDRDLHYLYLNAAVEVELGYTPEALIGQPLLAATLAPEHLAEWQTLTQQVAATRQEQTIEYQLRLQSRSIWFQTRVVPEYNMDGTVTSFLCVARNITQKKQAEARQAAYINVLLEWQNRHHAAQLATKQVLYEWDTSSNRMMWGINADQVFGYSASEMPQTSADWFANIHPEDEKRVQTAAAEYFERQGHLYLQYRWQHQSGHYIWIETQAQFFADANGNLTQIIGYVTDINERKRLEAERTQLETALRESEAQLRQIFDNSQDVFFLKSLDSKQMIYTSPAWEYLYQTPLQQTYDNPQAWLDFIHPDDRDAVVTFNQQACQGKEVCSFAYRIIRPDNSIRWLWNRSFPIRNEAGEIYRLAGANIDITEQKKLELELSVVKERYQLAIRGIGEGVWDWDIVSDRVIASDRYWEILGYSPPAKNACKFAYEMLREEIHPDDCDLMQLALKGHLEDHLPYEVEFRRRKQSGEYIWCRSRGEAIRDQTGKPIRMVGAIADITERKVMATALQASEETLRLVVNTVPGVVYTYCRSVDGTKSFRFISQGIIKLCDRTPEEILNDSQVLWHLIVPEDAERVRDLIDQSAAMLTPWTAEFRLITASGVLKWVSGDSIPSRQVDGSIVWHGILIDISDRKHAEAKLRQQEEFLRSIYTGAELAIFVIEVSIDQEFRFLEFNPVAERYGSVTCEEIQGKTPEEVFGEAVGSAIRQKYDLCLKSGQKISYEEYLPFPEGSIWALTNLFPIRSEAGNIHRIIGTAININDRKQAEAALRASEQTLSQVMNSVPGAVFKYRRSADAADGFVFISQGIVDLYEHTPEEILNNGSLAWDIALPEDMEQMSASSDRSAATLEPWEMEFRIRTASGVLKWILGHSIPSQEEDGSIVWCGILTDISDRKQAELERERSEALLQALIAASPIGLALFDRELRYLYGNEALAKINGLPLSEHLGRTLWEVLPEMASQFAPMLLQIIETQVPIINMEFSGEVSPGVFRSAISNQYPVCLPNGEVIGVGVSVMDITELVQAQQQLRESEARFHTLADNISQFAWITDEHGSIEWYNQRWFDYTGTTLAEMQGWGWQHVHHPDHIERVAKKISHCFETGEIWEDTFPLRGRDGQYRWFLSRAIPIRDEQGRVLRWFGTNTDISEQKQTEVALQTSEQILRQLTNMVPGAVYKYQRLPDGSKSLIFMSEGIVDLYEYTPEELLKDIQIVWDIISPEDIEQIDASIERSAATLEAWEMEFRIRTPSGILKWISGHSIPSQEEDGSIIWFGILTDISDRKQAQLALQASEQRYLNLAELSPVGIFHTDPSGDYKYVNSHWCQLAGLSFKEAMDIGWKRALHPEDRDWVLLNWQRATQSQTPFLMEYRFQRPDGKVHWLICLAIVETDTSGNVIGYIGTITDITERKYSEQALQESEQRYRSLAEAMPQMVWLADETGAVNYFNQRWYDYTGQSQAEAMGLGKAAAIHPDERDRTLQEWGEAIATGKLFEIEYRVRHYQGLYSWFLARGVPIQNLAGEITGWVGTITDIDDFKRAELARKQSEARFRAVFEQAAVGIVEMDVDGRFLQVNRRICDQFGYTVAELLELNFQSLIPRSDVLKFYLNYWEQLFAKKINSFSLEKCLLHKNGELRWYNITVASVCDADRTVNYCIGVIQDIQDRKHAQLELQKLNQELEARIARRTAALSESEVRYRSLFEQAAVGISQCHPSGRYIQVNQRFCELTGYTQSELLDMSWQDLIHLEDLELIQGELAHLHYGELGSITLEIRYIRKDRRLQWVSLTVSMLYNAAGTFIGDLAVVEDISDRKHIEQQLQNSEKRLKEIISKTVDGILILNSQGQILFSNPAADRIFNCQKADYQGADLGIFITLQKTFEMEIPHPTGRVTTVEVRVEEITWQAHKAFLAAIRDISHRKQTEIDLQASELSYRTLAENLPGIVYKLYPDRHNTFVFFNDRLTTLFQLDPIDIVNLGTLCPVNSLIVPEDRDRVIEVIQAAIVNQQPFQVEYCIQIPATQEKRYLLEQGSTVTDNIGQALHIVGIIFDVTEIKQTEEKLRKINERLTIANAELARATRLKDEFLANMSHELRTPLNSILGLSEVLQERTYGNLTEQQHHALTTIQTNGQHLLELINDILDLAKIESGKLDLQMKPVSVQQLCRSTILFIQQQAFKKQISFTLELSPDLAYIELDERLIRQVLINLLTNAVKFTPNGGAVILKVEGNTAEQTLSFSAIDTGIGIAPENIDKLFQPFVQIDSNLSRRYAGTGLGLALVRRIIELHKGSVTVRSTVGQGSEFTVVLPWKHVNPPNSDKPLDRTTAVAQIASEFLPVETMNIAEKPVVLLVDDNLDNIETLKAYLELKGFNIVVAHNGLQAINLTQTQSFNLILMDIQMPEMNGLEAIRQIRLQEQDKHIPILAVTALAMSRDKEQCLAAGANDYLTKPISPIHLVNVMKKYLQLS